MGVWVSGGVGCRLCGVVWCIVSLVSTVVCSGFAVSVWWVCGGDRRLSACIYD